MLISTYRLARTIAGAAAIVAIVYYGVVSSAPLPDHRLIVGYNDLVLHVAAFLVLSFLVLLPWTHIAARILALVSVAVSIEAVQIFDPVRNASIKDFVASLAGILAGFLIIWTIRMLWRRLLPQSTTPIS